MNSYNGRQITQMRFKDVRELEKFKFVSNGYDLQTERLEHVSQDKIWKSLINILMETYNKPINIPLILYDEAREEIYLGYVEGVVYTGYSVYSNSISSVDITYNSDDDILEITYTNEEIMSTDNVKTLFGNQSIIGTGNIDLYRHYLTITDINGKVAKFEWISSSNINVSGVGTKLKDLLKCSGIESSRKYGHGYEDSDLTTPCIMYWLGSSMGILSLKFGSSSPSEISNVVDIVETI